MPHGQILHFLEIFILIHNLDVNNKMLILNADALDLFSKIVLPSMWKIFYAAMIDIVIFRIVPATQ